MNRICILGRVVRVEKVEKQDREYWKVRISSMTAGGNIFITAFSFSEQQPAHVGDVVLIDGELRPIPESNGAMFISADRIARVKAKEQGESKEEGAEEKPESNEEEDKGKEVSEGENEGVNKGEEGETDEDVEDIEF